MLNGPTDPTFLHTYAKTQPNATSTSHVFAKYVTETSMLTNLGIFVKDLTGIHCGCIHIYMPHMKSPCENEHCTYI